MPPAWSRRALGAALAAAGGAGAALLAAQALRARGRGQAEEAPEESEELEALGSELASWLRARGLSCFGAAFAWHGYTELALLRDLSDGEVAELVAAVGLRAGHAARLRRGLRELRAAQRDPGVAALGADAAAADGSTAAATPAAGAVAAVSLGQAVLAVGGAAASAAGAAAPAAAAQEAAPASAAARVEPVAGTSEGGGGSSSSSARPAPLPVGSRAVLCGLAKRPDLNGSAGTLVAWDGAAGRWEFALEEGKGSIRVRPEHVQQLDANATDRSAAPGGTSELEVPEEFRCCITREVMEQPVITSDGHTYERVAIARWLEEHGTSPKTGQELPDKVLRPNHAIRAQILAWRERQGLPPLAPWEPEPQETVQTREPPDAPQMRMQPGGPPGPTVTVQTPAGSVVLPLALLQGGAMVGGNQAAQLTQALRANEALREEVLTAVREDAGGGQAAGDGAEDPDIEELARLAAQDPRIMDVVLQHLNAHPEAQPQAPGGMVVGPGGVFSNPGWVNGAQESPIFRAAREGECGVVEQLLGHRTGARLRQEQSAVGDSLLHVASWWGHGRLVSMLLAREHPVHVPSRNRSMPLHYAAFRGHPEVIRLLLDGQADTERRMFGGDTAVHQAAWQGHTEVLRLLLDRGAAMHAAKDDGDTALALAAFRGHVPACQELLARMAEDSRDEGVDMHNHHGATPLHAAAAGGSVEVIGLLIEAKAPVNARTDMEETALHRAVQAGASGPVTALLEARAEVEVARLEDDHTPLNLAVMEGRTGLVNLLIQHGASMAYPRRDGMSPVHLAVIRESRAPRRAGEGSVLAALVEAQVDPNSRARNQMTPLHLALGQLPQAPHRTAAIRSLLEQRADVEATLREGDRPLHMAVGLDLRVEAALLLEHRAAVNEARDDGSLPLHVAARVGAGACVELLMRARADLSCQNLAGQTAADVARQCGLEQIERLLSRPPSSTTSAG